MNSSPQWLSRYRRGQRDQVWHELHQWGSGIRLRPELAEEAQSVCDEMARRARQNIEVVVARLTAAGYRFHENDDEQTPVPRPYVPPTAQADAYADWLRDRFGAVPMTVCSWVRLVGDVWLVGTHPEWADSASADPLVIELEGSRHPDGPSLREYHDEEWTDWQEAQASDEEPGVFVLPVAPDRLHKENTSGGGPYGFVLPDGCVDGLFVGETTTSFVAYLNQVFGSGGFPWPTGSEGEWQVKRGLAEDLLPL
ncbi:hypothetical protein ACIBO1_04440 [Micromonospora sp. NPDC049903]|uniref:hypothetical protein n=1 Tax=Micromonospora sp. NPDC049903 TaxID=3364276 RepID=UPI003798062A